MARRVADRMDRPPSARARPWPALTLPVALGAWMLALATAARAGHPVVREVTESVDPTVAASTVEQLVAFGTRYSGTPEGDLAVAWIADRLTALGLEPVLEPFDWGGTTLHNVGARIAGAVRPEEIYLVVAHHDSTSDDRLVDAPGADDDASGVAAVLEVARVLRDHGFEATIEILLTGGEEQGLLGSRHDAQDALATGEAIAGVINHDMIGYWPTGWDRDLDVNGAPLSQRIVEAYATAAADYVPGLPVDARLDWGVCDDDQKSYHDAGFPALIVMDCREAHLAQDGESTPHYHRTTDTVDTLDLARMTEVIRATVAAVATLARPVRGLLRHGVLDEPVHLGATLRPGSELGGEQTALDPASPDTVRLEVPFGPHVDSGRGEPVGPGAPGALVLYESDRPEMLALERRDADGDGRMDIVVSFTP